MQSLIGWSHFDLLTVWLDVPESIQISVKLAQKVAILVFA